MKIIKRRCRFSVTNEDMAAIRETMKNAGIKGTARKGKGSCKFWVDVKTDDERIVDVMKDLGFRLVINPCCWNPYYTFEKGYEEIIRE